jgi:hypothetical protein
MMIERIFNPRFLGVVIIILLAFTLSGCAVVRAPPIYVRVDSSVVDSTKEGGKAAEVTITTLYSKMASQIKSVAISAPSSCANETASTNSGQAVNTGSIVKTNCGVEMAEIERALIRQGFTVYSWKLVADAINANSANNTRVSPDRVAKQLGAQVLFQVNSLERVIITPGRDARIERSFYGSNSLGEKLGPIELGEQRIKEIKAVTGVLEVKQLPSAQSLGAMLDINAIDSETGQSIWFYRWSKHEDTSKNIFASSLVQCWDNWGCRQELAENPTLKQNTTAVRSSEVETISTVARPANEQNATYFSLLQDVTTDFVKRFSSGK